MQTRPLGRSGLDVPPIIFGGNVFGWTADRDMSFRLLDALLDAGLNAIDTADVYSQWVPGHQGGESETIIGEWMEARGVRNRVVVLTKVGMRMGSGDEGLAPAWIEREVGASLKRLRTDHIDLYQAHRDDPSVPLEDTLAAFDKLVKSGKVRAIGASNYSGARLREALAISDKHGLARFESLQPHYNLVERTGYEHDLEPVCVENGLGVIPYFSLAAGFLTGKYRSKADLSKSPRGGGLAKYLDGDGLAVLAKLDEVAARKGAKPGQVALAWLIARPSITAPIASATTLEQLQELVGAATLTLESSTL